MGASNEGPKLFGFQPKTTLGSSRCIPLKGMHTPTAASRNPEVPDTLTSTLQSVSISEEHCTLMGTVVERVLSARSRLNETFLGLLRGVEVCNVIVLTIFHA